MSSVATPRYAGVAFQLYVVLRDYIYPSNNDEQARILYKCWHRDEVLER